MREPWKQGMIWPAGQAGVLSVSAVVMRIRFVTNVLQVMLGLSPCDPLASTEWPTVDVFDDAHMVMPWQDQDFRCVEGLTSAARP